MQQFVWNPVWSFIENDILLLDILIAESRTDK